MLLVKPIVLIKRKKREQKAEKDEKAELKKESILGSGDKKGHNVRFTEEVIKKTEPIKEPCETTDKKKKRELAKEV